MTDGLRPARAAECRALTALCLRSKAHWGYDAAFMAACRPSLTVLPGDLAVWPTLVAELEGRPAGLAQLSFCTGEGAELEKLFVDPPAMGRGLGARLFAAAADLARGRGAAEMVVISDPQAESFYRRMGARPAGDAPSEAIPGRTLPRLIFPLA